jgi:predicted MFS family arabinose efflux permease
MPPETLEPARAPVPAALTFTLALACGVAVANLYYVQPLVGLISRDLGMPVSSAGLLVTVTQLGYAAGLLLVVPLGDIVENRRLIVGMLGLLVCALVALTFAPNEPLFLIGSIVLGLGTSTVQIIVPFAGHLAPDATRGRIVGDVVSGLLFGIMLSRPVASFVAHVGGHHAIFALSAVATSALAVLLARVLPERRPRGMPYLQAIRSLRPLLLHTSVLRRRGAYQAALFGVFSLFWTAVPLLLEGPRFHFSQVGIGLFALAGAAGAIVSPYAGRAADAGKTRLVTLLSLTGAVLGCLAALAGGLLVSWPILMVAALLLDMAAAANLVVGQRAIFALGADIRGRLNGLYLALFFIGGGIGSLVAGFALAAGGWAAVTFVGLVFPIMALAYFATETPTEG